MAAAVPPADQAADMLNKLSLESQSNTLEATEPAKKPTVEIGDNLNGQNQPLDRSLTPLIPDYMDPTVAYFPNTYPSPYYYGGYDGAANEWEDYSRYLTPEGVDMTHGVYGDNGSLMYPGYGYPPYAPYSPAGSPVPTAGQDGQLYTAQHYQYPSPYFQPMTQSTRPFSANKTEISRSDQPQPPLTIDTSVKGTANSAPVRPPAVYPNSVFNASGNGSYNRGAQNTFGFDGVHSPNPWLDSSMYSDGRPRNNNSAPFSNANSFAPKNQSIRPHSHVMSPRPMSGVNAASGYMNRMYPNKLYNQYGNTYRSNYGSNYGYNSNWLAVDNKYKPRGRGNGFFGYNNENTDGLNELNRGPRARITKNIKLPTRVTIAVKGTNGVSTITEKETEVKEVCAAALDREQYNLAEFPETYADAKFFIIKSYSEDDVHKSIKYNVWSSTQNGNKKLDAAYQEAQQKSGQCPVFLFFSVNTSGQFVGVAEMVGPVDFNKSLEYWQQDKWIGCFPVKWHIVKDVPNSLLKHITLEYNENKPVTNSRDTQEVKLEQGLQVIKIFKEHSSKQCILDDFEFYEERQKRIQEKKAKQLQYQKQAWEEKPGVIEKNKEEVVIPQENVETVVGETADANGVESGC